MLQMAAIITFLCLIFGVWGGVHLLAQKRMGDRKLGCQGPITDDDGNAVCCQTGDACDKVPPRDATS